MEIHVILGAWYEKEKRDLPWRNTSDPYKIWLSEVILQQTRVAQGTGYYLRFLERFPDIFSLAEAKSEDVLKIWQGLGYYSRARNLHETARFVASHRNGEFPDTYSELLQLKGVGEYTAAAISSIAFNEVQAAVDGNVKRVISRLFSVREAINSPEGLKTINALAREILDPENPGRHNQALMELGAGICLPKKPRCINCPLNGICMAIKENRVEELPLKYGKAKVRNRFFTYLIIRQKEKIWLKQRGAGDIWQGLYEFPLIETQSQCTINDYPSLLSEYLGAKISEAQINRISDPITHKLSHQNLRCSFIHISFPGDTSPSQIPGAAISIGEFGEFPVPKLIERYISTSGF